MSFVEALFRSGLNLLKNMVWKCNTATKTIIIRG